MEGWTDLLGFSQLGEKNPTSSLGTGLAFCELATWGRNTIILLLIPAILGVFGLIFPMIFGGWVFASSPFLSSHVTSLDLALPSPWPDGWGRPSSVSPHSCACPHSGNLKLDPCSLLCSDCEALGLIAFLFPVLNILAHNKHSLHLCYLMKWFRPKFCKT